ncbi:UNVERIFIED_CONTAM: Sister chromatid cohesion 1 protein 1 [Sesamum angustifolium]|uniref:Sister chromatid cohesion 1 protein 1 n=1 Tax=Sesamum angustifolium TaxID=2727405 RepID=A0AAW2LDE4_9LAMI
MALRLSGILMGGVVIVYERKVKLLYDDVTRLLVEINEAWKVKSAPSDLTRLPKGKSQAKYEAITLPPNHNEDLGEIEQPLPYSDATTIMDFQHTSYISMRLDNVDDPYLDSNLQGDINQDHHQVSKSYKSTNPPSPSIFIAVDAANITLFDNYDSYQANATAFNRFERFDIEGDDETQLNFTPPENTEFPSSLIPSPPRQEELHKSLVLQSSNLLQETELMCKWFSFSRLQNVSPESESVFIILMFQVLAADGIQEEQPEEQVKAHSEESKGANQRDQMRPRPARRRARRPAALAMDFDQNIIPGPISILASEFL